MHEGGVDFEQTQDYLVGIGDDYGRRSDRWSSVGPDRRQYPYPHAGGDSNNRAGGKTFVARVAEILDLEESTVQDAFTQASGSRWMRLTGGGWTGWSSKGG